jgi:hypothetical protein
VDVLLSSLVSARGRIWAADAMAGAVAFWCLGALAVAGLPIGVPAATRCVDPDAHILCFLGDRDGVRFAAVLLLAVLGVIASTAVIAALTSPALAVVAGIGWPRGVAAPLVQRHERRRDRLVLGRGDPRLVWCPAGDEIVRPTRAGNAFASLQQRVDRRHGLDLPTCWPLVEQTLPEPARNRLETASGRLAGRIQNLLWTLLALAWLPWLPSRLAAVVAFGCASLAILLWWAIAAAAEQYCALVEATVAAYRRVMYAAVGWPPPRSTNGEPDQGRAFTGWLSRLRPFPDVQLEWRDDRGG